MKKAEIKKWTDKPWFRHLLLAKTAAYPGYFKGILKYIVYGEFGTHGTGWPDGIFEAKESMTVKRTSEVITHETTVRFFFHFKDQPWYGTTPAGYNIELNKSGGGTLKGGLEYAKGIGRVVDAVVINESIYSSRHHLVSDCYIVVLPEGSHLTRD